MGLLKNISVQHTLCLSEGSVAAIMNELLREEGYSVERLDVRSSTGYISGDVFIELTLKALPVQKKEKDDATT